jgi:hypothetical protein
VTVVIWSELSVHGDRKRLDVPGEMAQIIEVADGRIQRSRLFFTWEEALEAAGLREYDLKAAIKKVQEEVPEGSEAEEVHQEGQGASGLKRFDRHILEAVGLRD